ncbi:hypothetical protein [uncultured Maritimibacter sp.]|uniref:hypothetical protein n=1 Tax=uncultured Maritimibacter sp. TaxID=991866 RepID=UPI002598BF0A|nr:hypothetical protein [uncultured Maritimibacter sp.]
MTSDTPQKVYNLWPSALDMAQDLPGVSVRDIIAARNNNRLLDEKYDRIILQKAMFEGVYLRQFHLDKVRSMLAAQPTVDERKQKIADFYEAMGGNAIIAQHARCDEVTTRIWKSRARLPASKKYELMELSKARGFDLDAGLFEPVA